MSRELKFRCWNKSGKCWITFGCDRYCFDDGILDIMDNSDLLYEQYTGLTDKNGKEIYDGDIVEWVNGLGEKHIFEIIWNECRASFQMVEIGQEYPYILQGLSDKMKPYCEVIGNIHENTELLGGEE